MNNKDTRKLAMAALFTAVAVVGSLFQIPVLGSKMAPAQHFINVMCAVMLGPWYGLGSAFLASLIRNLLGIGGLMAFPGSMFGALLCGIVYWKTKNLPATLVGEVFGTAVLGGIGAYPIAIYLMGVDAAKITIFAYVFPFFLSTFAGAFLAGIVVIAMEKTGTLNRMKRRL